MATRTSTNEDVRAQNDDAPESEEDTTMTAAKSTATKTTAKSTTRKPAAKKATARKPAARKGTARTARKPRVLKPMSAATRSVAATVVGAAVTAVLSNEDLGVKRESSTELKGNRQGMKSRVVLDDGTVITTTVTVR
jgi:hypothetical protein